MKIDGKEVVAGERETWVHTGETWRGNGIYTVEAGSWDTEVQKVESPYTLRRKISMKESVEIKKMISDLRYRDGKDDAWFFNMAQAAQHEAKKIYKQGPKKDG